MTDYTFPNLIVDHADDDGILVVAINRPTAKNALDTATLEQLEACIETVKGDAEVKAIVITGAGKTFGIGADIPEVASDADFSRTQDILDLGHRVFTKLERLGKPSCAAINGVFCLGGSLEMALACTFRVAGEKVRLGLPEVTLGLIPGYGGTQRLPRLVGKGRALELILTGEPVRADAALAMGMVNQVVEPTAVVEASRALLRKVLKVAPVAVSAAMEAVHAGFNADLETGLAMESAQFMVARKSADAAEGLAAQQEGRKPEFTGK